MSKPLSKEELLAQFDTLDGDHPPAAPHPVSRDEDDPVAELAALAAAKPPSRAATPKPSSSSTASNRSPRRTGQLTPASTASTRNSEDRGAAAEKNHQNDPPPLPSAGAGWWGSILNTASAAAKQAESALKEIQGTGEAQKLAERVKGNVGLLRSYGDELRSRAIPTFTQLLHTLAPPISQHERLLIHIAHDLHNYPSLDPIVYSTFSRVMSQVEGGDLMVIQRGSESRLGSADSSFAAGWTDGPWWRDVGAKRDLGAVRGLTEGTKLARATAEGYASDFFAAKGGLEEAAKAASEILSESNPVRSSDIFLAIQPISHGGPTNMFASEAGEQTVATGGVEGPVEADDDLICFAIYLNDPIHSITFHALSQSLPQKWADWLDASPSAAPGDNSDPVATLPAEIREIIESGGVDPREWAAEWMEDSIRLAVGVVAQRYVARRMGVGEGAIGRGKARQRPEESNGGEAARAI